MTTFTDKELIKEIRERIGSLDVRDNIERRAYEIALASLEAEPVAWKVTFTQIDREYNTFTGMYSDKAEVERWVRLHKACNFRADITPLYTAKPVPVTPDGWISCSDRMPVIGELNWRTSFPLLVTCEIGVISAYYGFVSVNGDRHYGFMESLKYGDDSGNHPQTNEYGLISNVTHWMPLPEPPQEVNRG
ncbi:TPA: DUF551 domain-containing protein [Escherichia coli]|nr:DUF551 domain-containing protein [Escherichia coli]